MIVIRGVRITGATVYSAADFAPLYAGEHRAPRPAHDGLRHRAAHHRQIRPRRLRALARGGAAAGVERERIDRPHPGGRGLHRPGGVAGLAVEISQFLRLLRRQDHRRPPDQRQNDGALSAAGGRPAGAEVQEQPEAVGDPARRRHSDYRGRGKADRLSRPRRQSRHQGARALSVFQQPERQQSAAHPRILDVQLRRHLPVQGAAIRRARLPAGAHARRPDLFPHRNRHPQQARHADARAAGVPARAATSSRAASATRSSASAKAI